MTASSIVIVYFVHLVTSRRVAFQLAIAGKRSLRHEDVGSSNVYLADSYLTMLKKS